MKNIQLRLVDGSVSVMWFGAVGDGNIDDTAAFNAAMNALSIGGGILVIPPCIFRITSSIVVPSNITIQGSGKNSIIRMDNKTALFRAFINSDWQHLANGNSNIVIRDLTIDGNRPNHKSVASWRVSTKYNENDEVFFNIKIYRCIVTGISANANPSETDLPLNDGTVVWELMTPLWQPLSDAIFLTNCKDSLIDNCEIKNSRNDGIIIEYGENNIVRSCYIHDCNKAGIYCSGADKVSISDNQLIGNYEDIALALSWYCAAANNICESIILGRDSRYCTIHGNICETITTSNESVYGDMFHTISYPKPFEDYVYGFSKCVIANNIIRQFNPLRTITGSGIVLRQVSECVVSGNVIEDHDNAGIYLHGGVGNKISGNRIKNCANSHKVTNAGILLLQYETGKLTGVINTQKNIISENDLADDRSSPLMAGIIVAGISDYNAIFYNRCNVFDKPVVFAGTGTNNIEHDNYTL